MSAEGKPFQLGTLERWGETTCGYGLEEKGQVKCTKPATIHIGWLTEPFAISSTCDEHLAFIEANADRDYDQHTHGPNCGMPGALWHFPYEDEDEGYCLFPAVDDLSGVVEELEPAAEVTTS